MTREVDKYDKLYIIHFAICSIITISTDRLPPARLLALLAILLPILMSFAVGAPRRAALRAHVKAGHLGDGGLFFLFEMFHAVRASAGPPVATFDDAGLVLGVLDRRGEEESATRQICILRANGEESDQIVPFLDSFAYKGMAIV